MWRRVVLVIIVLTAAWCVYGTYFASVAYGDWGFSAPPVGITSDTRVFSVRRVEPGSPAARAGIVAGDRLRGLVPHAFPLIFITPGTRADFEVTHGSSRRVVTLIAATKFSPRYPTETILFVLEMTQLGLAFLLAWRRWSDRDARPLVVFFVCHAATMATSAFTYIGTSPLALPAFDLVNFLAVAALIRFAAIYPSNVPASPVRRTFAAVAPALALALGLVYCVWALSLELLNVSFLVYAWYRYVSVVLYDVLPIVGLILGLVGSVGAERKRLALLLGFFVVGNAGPVAYSILIAGGGPSYSKLVRPLLATLIVQAIGFVYLIFRERLFDVSFVLNRAAVYAAISTLLLPLLLLGEWAAEHFLTGGSRTENALVQVGIALLLFVVARQLYDRIDRLVDRLLFRERHENENALRSFARRVTLLDDARAIGDQAVQAICSHTDATYVALYRRDANGDYVLSSRKGEDQSPSPGEDQSLSPAVRNLPALVDRNDPAVLALRADRTAVENLRDSAFAEALVLPCIGARGLAEFLVCGPKRSDETYAPDERDALLQLAHGVAVAFDAVHISELETRLRATFQPAT
jgi:hypothetical protein